MNTNPSHEPADDELAAIGEALGRLRGRRRGVQSHTHRGGHHHGGHPGGARHGLPEDIGQDATHDAGHDGAPDSAPDIGPFDARFTRPGHGGRSREPFVADPRLTRGLGGPPAIVRTIEVLAKAKEPLGVSELAEAIGVDQPRASRLVQQGVARGLLVREADPEDARRTRIALTERGLQFAHGLRNYQREALGTALEGFTDDERADLARLLTKLADNWPA